jgi:hypothetical protein
LGIVEFSEGSGYTRRGLRCHLRSDPTAAPVTARS